MNEYKTILYDAGKYTFDDELRKEINDGWAIYNIWQNPNKKYIPLCAEIIVTFVKTKQVN